jgi:hypothetical protein
MERPEFFALCRGVNGGEARFVEDVSTHRTAKVLSCDGNRLMVEVEDHQESWPSEQCHEKWLASS